MSSRMLLLILSTASAVYVIDDTPCSIGACRSLFGVGGLSGGGATSVLLPFYPPAQRSEILDYLFTPNYGANL